MNACHEFRSRLADLLAGRAFDQAFAPLAWHEHLLSCAECRALLSAEEALDELLASLPEPHLPPALAQRLLARLEPARAEVELDTLLDRSMVGPVPENLARNVLAKLAAARAEPHEDHQLDRVLELLPEPVPPADLARRVLLRAALERKGVQPARSLASPRMRRVLVAASILVVAGASIWALVERSNPKDDAPLQIGANDPAAEDPPEELLAQLDLFESWDVLLDDSVEADVNALGPVDELLLGLDVDGERPR